ncbi:MAG: TolC family protein [Chitinophagaceae bacterium]|nr:TolC family protein [Chitinophagaceae bacterium]
MRTLCIIGHLRAALSCCAMILVIPSAHSQSTALSIREALTLVQTRQPGIQAFKERATAVGYNTNLVRNTLTPDLTVGYQANYATYNNITGMSYPSLVMPISGPPSASSINDPVPGTALAALVKWTPWTFGQRQAAIDKAAAQYKLAGSEYNDALFRSQYAVLQIYLDIVYLRRLLTSLQAGTDRIRTALRQSLVLAKEGLRPGIDTVQFQAALAQSEIDFLTTQRTYLGQMVELSRLTALPGAPENILLTDTLVAYRIPVFPDTTVAFTGNPKYLFYKAKLDLSFSFFKEIQRSWRPHLDLWANAYSRGSGVSAGGTVNKSNGWQLDHNNYGLGFQLSFPILQFSQTNLSKKQFRSYVRADQAQLDQVSLDLSKQAETVRINLRQDRLIAEHTPAVTQAQQFAYKGLQLSYQNGLIDYTRLEQGQYDLLKAEIAQASAYIQVWRSLLDMAVVTGQLNLFTEQVSQP